MNAATGMTGGAAAELAAGMAGAVPSGKPGTPASNATRTETAGTLETKRTAALAGAGSGGAGFANSLLAALGKQAPGKAATQGKAAPEAAAELSGRARTIQAASAGSLVADSFISQSLVSHSSVSGASPAKGGWARPTKAEGPAPSGTSISGEQRVAAPEPTAPQISARISEPVDEPGLRPGMEPAWEPVSEIGSETGSGAGSSGLASSPVDSEAGRAAGVGDGLVRARVVSQLAAIAPIALARAGSAADASETATSGLAPSGAKTAKPGGGTSAMATPIAPGLDVTSGQAVAVGTLGAAVVPLPTTVEGEALAGEAGVGAPAIHVSGVVQGSWGPSRPSPLAGGSAGIASGASFASSSSFSAGNGLHAVGVERPGGSAEEVRGGGEALAGAEEPKSTGSTGGAGDRDADRVAAGSASGPADGLVEERSLATGAVPDAERISAPSLVASSRQSASQAAKPAGERPSASATVDGDGASQRFRAVPQDVSSTNGDRQTSIPALLSAGRALAASGRSSGSGAAAGGVAQAAGPVPAQGITVVTGAESRGGATPGAGISAGDLIAHMDSGQVPGVSGSQGSAAGSAGGHLAPHSVAVGVEDPAHGWIEVRAEGVSGQVTASLSAATVEAHAALHAQLPGMAEYLAEREIGVRSLGMAGSGTTGSVGGQGMGPGDGFGSAAHPGGGYSGSGSGTETAGGLAGGFGGDGRAASNPGSGGDFGGNAEPGRGLVSGPSPDGWSGSSDSGDAGGLGGVGQRISVRV